MARINPRGDSAFAAPREEVRRTPLKHGKFFRVPEGPDDMERLWADAVRLDLASLPEWLTVEDLPDYRLIPSPDSASIPSTLCEHYQLELNGLVHIGLIVDERPDDPAAHIIHMERPRRDEVWSIGLYMGTSPWNLAPAPGIANPIITRTDVTDVTASTVADPFLIHANGTWHLFFEVLNWKTRQGEIGLATSADGREWNYRQIVLTEEFHLSYPCVFEWQGHFYMTPESHFAGEVRLYRADNFPFDWKYVGPLLSGPYLADATPFRHRERWWMYVDASPEQQHDTLRLYSADDLLGPWREHPLSPVIRNDPRHARPAGRVIVHDGRLIRLAQSSIPDYGTEVFAFEVIELTESAYRERPVRPEPILGPGREGWNAGGMHHLDAQLQSDGSWLAVVDGWRRPPDDA